MAHAKSKVAVGAAPRITVGFAAKDHERLQKIADEHERSLSWIVRQAVRAFLDQKDRGQLDLDFDSTRGD